MPNSPVRDKGQSLARYIRAESGIPMLQYVNDSPKRIEGAGLTFLMGTTHGHPTWTAVLSQLPEDGIAAVLRYNRGNAGSPGEATVITRLRNYVPLLGAWSSLNMDRLRAERERD